MTFGSKLRHAARPSLTLKLMLFGLAAAVVLWLGFDFVHSRRLATVVEAQLGAELDEDARIDRMRFERHVRAHHLFARLTAGQEAARRAIAAAVASPAGAPSTVAGDPPWLMPPGDRQLFPLLSHVLVLDGAGRLRRRYDIAGDSPPAGLLAIDARTLALARQQQLFVLYGGLPYLVSSAEAGNGATLVVASRLDSAFLNNAMGAHAGGNQAAVLASSVDGTIYASNDAVAFPPGRKLDAGAAWMTAGKAFFDYGGSEVKMSFATLVPRATAEDRGRKLLALERTQRTMLAAALTALFFAVLLYLGLRLRRLTAEVAHVTEQAFQVCPLQFEGDDELDGLKWQIDRLAAEVVTSRAALEKTMAEEMAVKAQVDRLLMLRGVTEVLEVGVINLTAAGPVAENAVMERWSAEFGGLDSFVAAYGVGDSEIHMAVAGGGERVFELVNAPDVAPSLLLVEDVTERRRAERDMASLALFPTQNPHPVLRIDAAGIVTHANDASQALLEQWNAPMGQPAPESRRATIVKALRGGRPIQEEVTVGSRVLALSLVPLAGAGYVNVYGHDVTDRVFAEQQLIQSNEWLEQRVAERTAALEAAKDAAEIASRSKSEFLASVSHELRTPLNAIIGFSEVMESGLFGPIDNPRYDGYVGDILSSARHLLTVINDILDISKIEERQMQLQREPIALGDVVAAAIRLVESRARAGRLTLHKDIAPDTPVVDADRRRLLQICANLLSNAVKFTPEGGSVRVSVRREGADALIEVSDTGIGMDAGEIAVALEPFRQVDGTLGRRYEGTGLGLPLARSFAELHGGSLEVASVKGDGTRIAVRIPLEAAAQR